MYKPPDDEQPTNDMQDEEATGRPFRVRRRQSAVPRQVPAKPRKEFYSDEHPEVPKVRRASLNKTRAETPPASGLEDEELDGQSTVHTRNISKRARKDVRPLTEREDDQASSSPYTRLVQQQRRREMPPFTGFEDDSANATGIRQSQRTRSTRKIPVPTRGYDLEAPQPLRRRPSNRAVASKSSRVSTAFFWMRKNWLPIGLVALVALIILPVVINTFHNATIDWQNASNGQGGALNNFQTISANPHELVIAPPNSTHPAPPVLATSAYLLDANSGATYYAQNPFLHLPMLSTTKLMTAGLAVEEGNLDQTITITPAMEHDINQLSADSATFGVKQGETYTLRDLLYGLLYVSGNDAALVIADALAGNAQNFVAQMNQKAQVLGLRDTHFVNPHGLLDANQYSCARDLAVLGLYSLSIPIIQQMGSGKSYHIAAGGNHPERTILNENQFLWWYPGVVDGKTGYDGGSDFIQVMMVTRDNRKMVGVVMHTNDWWTDMRNLMDYGANDYTWVSPHDADTPTHPIIFDNLWNYFVKDTPQNTIPTANSGQYYIYTGYSVSGPILAYFNQQGGLQKFGYPTKMPVPLGSSVMSQQFQHGTIQCDFTSKQCRAG